MVQQRGKQEAVARGREDKPGRDKTEQKQNQAETKPGRDKQGRDCLREAPEGWNKKKAPQKKQKTRVLI